MGLTCSKRNTGELLSCVCFVKRYEKKKIVTSICFNTLYCKIFLITGIIGKKNL